MDDVSSWLMGIGLGQYAQTFSDNAVDHDVLIELTDQDLISLGIVLGHRKKLLKAIEQLNGKAPSPVTAESDRRLLTVMFCDLVGSPDRELIRHYQKACTSVVAAYDGFVAQYLSDGIMAYFGYPRPREDAAERAVSAALDIVEAVKGLRETPALQVRIGITTGTSVVGDVIGQGSLAQLQAASGQTPNLAARIHALAEPQQILIGEPTKRRVGTLFDCIDLGKFTLKGSPEPVKVWRVLAENKSASRADARPQNSAPLVGRRDEKEALDRLWHEAREGGRAVLISGEDGIGKSSLVEAFRQHLRSEPHAELRWHCSPRHANTPFYPFAAHLAMAADLASQSSDSAKVNRLMALLSRTGQHETLDLPLLVQLQSIPTTGLMSLSGLTPAHQRELTIEALLRYIRRSVKGQPALLVFEDLHWIDPSSLAALTRGIEGIAGWPALLIMTARPDFTPPWSEQAPVSLLKSHGLAPEEAKAMIGSVAAYRELPTPVEEMIIRKAGGNPLFIKELTKLVLDSGQLTEKDGELVLSGSLQALNVPETLQDLLMERLDRWPALKEVAQIGSVIGGEFSYRMISAVSEISERLLQGSLQQLSSSDIISARGQAPEMDYVFRHALMQDAAYASLLRDKRQKLHKRVAETLAHLSPDVAAAAPHIMAHHLKEAGEWLEAIRYFHKAGVRLMQRSANVEAVQHLSDGITLLARLSDGKERTNWRFSLNLALGQASFVANGPGARETTEAFAIAQGLLEKVGDLAQPYDVLYGIFGGYMMSCRLDLAAGPADRVLEMAIRTNDSRYRSLGNRMLGVLAVHRGDFVAGKAYLAEALREYDPEIHRPLAFRYGVDIHVIGELYLAGIECFEGKRDTAFTRAEDALNEAHTINHAWSIAQAYAYNSYVYFYYGDRAGALDLAEIGYAFCSKANVGLFAFIFRIVTAWAQGTDADVIRQMMTGYADAGGVIGLPLFGTMLAEVLLEQDDAAGALEEMRRSLDAVRRTGELFFEPLVLQVLGSCLLAAGERDEAVRILKEAVLVSRRMGAVLYERKAEALLTSLMPSV